MAERFESIDLPQGSLWCGTDLRPWGVPVVLVHGFSVDLEMWNMQMSALAGWVPTVRYDLRGFGRSGRPSASVSHLDDLVDLLDRFEIDAALLVGLSLGANVCTALAVHHPSRVVGVVLASPGLPGWAWTTPRPPELAAEYARRHGIEPGRRHWLDHPMFAATRERPAALAELTRMVERFPAYQWMDGPQTMPMPSLVEEVAMIECPTAIVSGGRDDLGYLEIAAELATAMPSARHLVIDGAGHFVNLDEPDDFNRHLARAVALARATESERPC